MLEEGAFGKVDISQRLWSDVEEVADSYIFMVSSPLHIALRLVAERFARGSLEHNRKVVIIFFF